MLNVRCRLFALGHRCGHFCCYTFTHTHRASVRYTSNSIFIVDYVWHTTNETWIVQFASNAFVSLALTLSILATLQLEMQFNYIISSNLCNAHKSLARFQFFVAPHNWIYTQFMPLAKRWWSNGCMTRPNVCDALQQLVSVSSNESEFHRQNGKSVSLKNLDGGCAVPDASRRLADGTFNSFHIWI